MVAHPTFSPNTRFYFGVKPQGFTLEQRNTYKQMLAPNPSVHCNANWIPAWYITLFAGKLHVHDFIRLFGETDGSHMTAVSTPLQREGEKERECVCVCVHMHVCMCMCVCACVCVCVCVCVCACP